MICELFANTTTPMNPISFNLIFDQKVTSFAVSLIAVPVLKFWRFMKLLMLTSGRHDKMGRIDATFSFAPVMQDLVIKRFSVTQFPYLPVSRTAALCVAVYTNRSQPQPATRIGFDVNKISNTLRKSARFELKHTGLIVAEMLRWGQFFSYGRT